MSESLYTLVKQSKTDNNSLEIVIELFSPKIDRSLQQTKWQYREDLSQELKIKLLDCIRNYEVENTPGYFQMLDILEEKGIQYYQGG
ncbi:helix-turn-helix domain-containing protein [Paenisporosarcina macmurdoensis]|uniref:Helix-turn-helix domain-containing protein n=1 Tax=Paenisporosarcina macmurdoensis TaxID=212659 RepID=A0ABW1L9V3_9BACL|nr:helix-turn-helix domain-containing protein [Paenisporosarcina sp.]